MSAQATFSGCFQAKRALPGTSSQSWSLCSWPEAGNCGILDLCASMYDTRGIQADGYQVCFQSISKFGTTLLKNRLFASVWRSCLARGVYQSRFFECLRCYLPFFYHQLQWVAGVSLCSSAVLLMLTMADQDSSPRNYLNPAGQYNGCVAGFSFYRVSLLEISATRKSTFHLRRRRHFRWSAATWKAQLYFGYGANLCKRMAAQNLRHGSFLY